MYEQPFRILALAPGTRHLGLAFIENGELVRFGVKAFKGRKDLREFPAVFDQYMQRLIERHRPSVIVFEEVLYPQARLSKVLQKLLVRIKAVARQAGIATRSYSPLDVKRAFCEEKPTRSNLTRSICNRFPFLSPYCKRRACMPYWQQMFDAVGLGVFEHRTSEEHRREKSRPLTTSKRHRYL